MLVRLISMLNFLTEALTWQQFISITELSEILVCHIQYGPVWFTLTVTKHTLVPFLPFVNNNFAHKFMLISWLDWKTTTTTRHISIMRAYQIASAAENSVPALQSAFRATALRGCDVECKQAIRSWNLSNLAASQNHLCYKYLQIQRIEEQDQVFALEISKAHFLELSIVDSCGLKSRSWLSDSSCPSESSWKMEESHLFTWSHSFMKQATQTAC